MNSRRKASRSGAPDGAVAVIMAAILSPQSLAASVGEYRHQRRAQPGLHLLADEGLGTILHQVFERLAVVGDERADHATVEPFREAIEAAQRDRSASLAALELCDRGKADADATSELRLGHSQRLADRARPTLGRTLDRHAEQGLKALI